MPVVWSDRHRLHEPGGEVWLGERTPGTEVAERAERIRAALDTPIVESRPQPDAAALAVHDRALLDYLEHAWSDWEQAGLSAERDRVVPYLFPHPGLGATATIPAAVTARAGAFAYDTMTLIGPGTWEAARAALDVAVTAAELVRDDAPAAYALTRPPGHHVTRSCFGGSCYLNNAAAAAARLAERGTVAVLDIDAHHGNGTQAIFYDNRDVLTGSVHVDPGAGWFPHYLGFADETGGGANRNVPLAPGSGDDAWLTAIEQLLGWAKADALVVALGVDAAEGDPESPLRVSARAFHQAGRMIADSGRPTVFVQEGGYDLETIGGLVRAVLTGFEAGR